MLKELMLPAEVKLLKPNPAGCWHCVPAMMHGLLVLCGPRVFPCIGPVRVSTMAEAVPVSANIAAVAPIPIHASRRLRHMTRSLALKIKLKLTHRPPLLHLGYRTATPFRVLHL